MSKYRNEITVPAESDMYNSGMDAVSVSVTYEIKDLYIFNLIESYTNTSYQFFGAMSVLSLVSLPFSGLTVIKYSSVLLALFIRVILPLIYLLAPLTIYFDLKKRIIKYKKVSEEKKYFISNFGIEIESVSSNVNWRWSEVERFTETKWYVAMFVSKTEALLIPKRCLSNIHQLELLMKILKLKISKKK